MDGIFNVNKPSGRTSFEIVAAVKRLTGEHHAGHAGTLDPNATGVLPVCLGKATRIVEFMMDARKTYRAEVELGKATDTYDGSGEVIYQRDISGIDISKVEQALARFRGNVEQVPPMYSAVKHRGQPLYRLARTNTVIQRKSRKVSIHRLELISWQPPLLILEIECSKGTYIRSLAHDLGEALGCGAYLKNLVRTRYGLFDVEYAVSLAQLEEACRKGDWQQYLYPIDCVLQDMEKVIVNEEGEKIIRTGSLLKNLAADNENRKYNRAYSKDGRFLAILAWDKESEHWRPKKVFI